MYGPAAERPSCSSLVLLGLMNYILSVFIVHWLVLAAGPQDYSKWCCFERVCRGDALFVHLAQYNLMQAGRRSLKLDAQNERTAARIRRPV